MNITQINLNEIDLKRLGLAPLPVRAGVAVVLAVVIMGAGFYFDTRGRIDELQRLEVQEQELRRSFAAKAGRAANLEELKEQLAEMEQIFGELLRQLPSGTEIPALIDDISHTALASGLEIDLFRPLAENPRGFYAEKSIQITLRGSYQQMGNFVSGISALPRIVTLHDVGLRPATGRSGLAMSVMARIYRYMDDEDG